MKIKNRSGPVSRVLSRVIISLGRRLLTASSQPTRRSNGTNRSVSLRSPSCLVLLPVGFTLPMPSPTSRCALTAPFHPCLCGPEPAIGGLFSVALSLSSRTVGVTHHRVLWSPDFPPPGLAADTAITRPTPETVLCQVPRPDRIVP